MSILEENNNVLRFETLEEMLEYIKSKIIKLENDNKEYDVKLYYFE